MQKNILNVSVGLLVFFTQLAAANGGLITQEYQVGASGSLDVPKFPDPMLLTKITLTHRATFHSPLYTFDNENPWLGTGYVQGWTQLRIGSIGVGDHHVGFLSASLRLPGDSDVGPPDFIGSDSGSLRATAFETAKVVIDDDQMLALFAGQGSFPVDYSAAVTSYYAEGDNDFRLDAASYIDDNTVTVQIEYIPEPAGALCAVVFTAVFMRRLREQF